MSNRYILVTGPAASGKSTLVSSICEDSNYYFYKPSQAYIDVAREKEIPKSRIFYDVKQLDVTHKLIEICQEHYTVIGDQHLSIQHKRDSAIAIGDYTNIDINEPYVSALDYNLIEEVLKQDVSIQLIYLKATARKLYQRAYQRYIETGFVLRNKTIEEVQTEIEAEEYYFNELRKLFNLQNYIIDTNDKSKEEIKRLTLKRIGDK